MNKKDAIELLERLILAAYNANHLATSQILARGLVELVKGLPDIAKRLPDMSREWWVISEHGIPELDLDTLYVYEDENGDFYTRNGREFNASSGTLWDRCPDRVLKIKEAA